MDRKNLRVDAGAGAIVLAVICVIAGAIWLAVGVYIGGRL